MPCTRIYHGGLDPTWRLTQLENQIVDTLAQQLETQFPEQTTVVAVTSWHDPQELIDRINSTQADQVFLCSLTDPLGPIDQLLDQIKGEVKLFGYFEGKYFYDFWALACTKFFESYNIADLEPTQFEHLFLNYNRKPKWFRRRLVQLFEESGLINHGCVTLPFSPYTVHDDNNDYVKHGSTEVFGDVLIPNDHYSLGQLRIWQTSFINVVSETEYSFGSNVFFSEKIYKPIIGLRPFVLVGSPGIYRVLKNLGFDCFEDLFDVDGIMAVRELDESNVQGMQLVVDSLQRYIDRDWMELYQSIRPRLVRNRELFYQHAANQELDRIII